MKPGSEWSAYYAASLGKPLHPLVEQLQEYLPDSGLALDLGCGIGTMSKFLCEQGLSVVGIDADEEAIQICRGRFGENPRLRFLQADLATYDMPQSKVIVAFFSLFFLKDYLPQVWTRICGALEPGGIFAGQFLGVHDDWAKEGLYALAKAGVDQWLEDFEVLCLEEAERDGETLLKEPKHWHVFHVIARKKAAL